jgi:hypothetical protein
MALDPCSFPLFNPSWIAAAASLPLQSTTLPSLAAFLHAPTLSAKALNRFGGKEALACSMKLSGITCLQNLQAIVPLG